MFFTYVQNNSGGSFRVTDDLRQYTIVEADTADQANQKAMGLGIYFNGVRDEIDCECCGDRWYPAGASVVFEDDEATEVPCVYGEPVELVESDSSNGCSGIVHYADGTVKYFNR